ncbi:uncharacterized protein N7511_010447 [Penicillium nucicola]|uniref:uncharacterized protein n=1 Tax=Penicillium nucicola TaxID=1850975 RepID=UPI0025458601|nr:uncharacterized protein N7511_010447 [Penicillium nucicola]KAJ5748751.1 hypothetical protein N7511_010447 [Penicillium nucicola]
MYRVDKGLAISSRSRPVSCHFCRKRKLKCSRQFPCSNCTSRGKECQLYPILAAQSLPTLSDPQKSENTSVDFNADVLARLRRLEDIVIGESSQSPNQTGSHPSTPTHKTDHSIRSLQVESSSAAAVDWLEGEITSPGLANCLLEYDLEFKTCPIQKALKLTPAVSQSAPRTKCIWLPLYEETLVIIEKYIREITYLHHVAHTPSLRALIEKLYSDIRDSRPVEIGQVSLLLGILASTTTFWTEHDMHIDFFPSVEEANGQSIQWMRLALEVIEYSRSKHTESLEDVQAMIILIFVTTNLVGIASQARYLVSMAISMARELSLHRIDHPHNRSLDIPPRDSARAEIGRRVWWYVVATDWQMSQISGPQKGTYSIDPRHMMTDKPINVNDEDLIDGMIRIGKPIEEPTSMSYCLQRIRLGEFCREITDSAPFGMFDPGTPDYEQTQQIDIKICEFVSKLPTFFSLSFVPDNIPKNDPRQSTGINIQRYIFNFMIHTQRCRLHLPYLSRSAKDPAYEPSRKACLEAARMVIQTEHQLSREMISFVTTRLKFSGMIHCVCVAIIVLLIDYCLGSSQQENEQGREREILDAFEILEEAKGHSPFAKGLLECFKNVLRQRNITTPAKGKTMGPTIQEQTSAGHLGNFTMPTGLTDSIACIDSKLMDPTMPSLDELWQAFDESVDSAAVDWNTLFTELDTPFLSM